MVMEYVSGGELFDYIVKHGKLKEEVREAFNEGPSLVNNAVFFKQCSKGGVGGGSNPCISGVGVGGGSGGGGGGCIKTELN